MAHDERDNIPFPIDNGLIQDAMSIGSGIWAHDLNREIGNYRIRVDNWNKGFRAYDWYAAVATERTLRGTVAEAKLQKNYHAPWATRRE